MSSSWSSSSKKHGSPSSSKKHASSSSDKKHGSGSEDKRKPDDKGKGVDTAPPGPGKRAPPAVWPEWYCVECKSRYKYPTPYCLSEEVDQQRDIRRGCSVDDCMSAGGGHIVPYYKANENPHLVVCGVCYVAKGMTPERELEVINITRNVRDPAKRARKHARNWGRAVFGVDLVGASPASFHSSGSSTPSRAYSIREAHWLGGTDAWPPPAGTSATPDQFPQGSGGGSVAASGNPVSDRAVAPAVASTVADQPVGPVVASTVADQPVAPVVASTVPASNPAPEASAAGAAAGAAGTTEYDQVFRNTGRTGSWWSSRP